MLLNIYIRLFYFCLSRATWNDEPKHHNRAVWWMNRSHFFFSYIEKKADISLSSQMYSDAREAAEQSRV